MPVRFAPVTRDNWLQVGRLEVRPGQQAFVAPNFISLAESRFYPEMVPLAIYDDQQLVGFWMYGFDPRDSTWWIVRLMIDSRYQGRGYGRAAMQAAIGLLGSMPGCANFKVSYDPQNHVAEALYRSLGFRPNGEVLDGEIVAVYEIK